MIINNVRTKTVGTIELYTHGFKVIAEDDRVAVSCRIVLKDWAIYGEKISEAPDGKRVKQQIITQTYGAALPNNKEFWLHKGQFTDFQSDLLRHDLTTDDFVIKRMPVYKPFECSTEMADGRIPYDYQIKATEFAVEPVKDDDHFSKLIGMPPGTGKATSNRTLVLTPSGWIKMGDIKVGDEVITPNWEVTKVTGVFPQGVVPLYNVKFEDGRSREVCKDHLWEIEKPCGMTQVIRTADLLESLMDEIEITIPLVKSKASEIWSEIVDRIFKHGKAMPLEGFIVPHSVFEDIPDITDIIYEHGGKALSTAEGLQIVHVDILDIAYKDRLKIIDIDKIDDDEATCISVEHPDKLFIIEDYIVTHNTITLCYISTKVKQRMVIGVLKKYAKKWPSDLEENLKIKPKQIMVISESDQLRGVIDLCKSQGHKKLPPYIVITLSTLRGFIDSFELDPEDCVDDYGCMPHELWGLLGCGLFAIDEAHEHLNTVFKTAMYLHGPKFVALSGTMQHEDPFQVKLQQTVFPNFKRFKGIAAGKHTELEFISYRFAQNVVRNIRYQAFGRSDYSHAIFEQSIMRYPTILRDYLQMACILTDYGYKELYQKGDKCIVFVGTVEMADKFMECFTVRYRDLNVVRYCKSDGDDYDDMLKGDIVITTVQSGGTGIDIKKLTYLNNFAMVNSGKSNIQLFYRLRAFEGRRTLASMPYNSQNPKHIKYTNYRREMFADKTKSIRTFNYNQALGA